MTDITRDEIHAALRQRDTYRDRCKTAEAELAALKERVEQQEIVIGFQDQAISARRFKAEAEADRLRSQLEAAQKVIERLIPTNINLDHPGLKDDLVVPCDVTLGELRAAASWLKDNEG